MQTTSHQLNLGLSIPVSVFSSDHLDNGSFAGYIPGHGPVPLYVAFSGGRSSAYMVERILRDYGHMFSPVYITFANTGQEHEKTLDFVFQCQKHWERRYNTTVVWLEALVNKKLRKVRGAGTRYRVVDFYSATRDYQHNGPFTDVIEKYGLPSPASPNVCNRELKLAPQNAFRRDLEKQTRHKNIYTAIGIRGDEPDRLDSVQDQRTGKYCYPMADLFDTDKLDVLDFWDDESGDKSDLQFGLELPEELGNCITCWKKSNKKLISVAKHSLMNFYYFDLMETLHSRTNVPDGKPDRRFFRGHLSSQDFINMAVYDANEKEVKKQAAQYQLSMVAAAERAMEASGTCTEECQAAPNVAELNALSDELDDELYTPPHDLLGLFAQRQPVMSVSALYN